MVKLQKKTSERLTKTIGKFQKILQVAKDRDINEADTVLIIGDILSEVFGFDKYIEITSEYAIRNTYCDLAIKSGGEIQYLIEVKAIGLDLNDNHLRQVIDYGANHGVQWVVLTNGIIWEIFRIRFEKPLNYDLVCKINLLEINKRKARDLEKLFLLCKEGVGKAVREEFHERVQSVNRFIIGSLLQGDTIVNTVRREIKKLSPGLKVENDEILKILKNGVLKREVLDGSDASRAQAKIKRMYGKASRKTKKSKPAVLQVEGPEQHVSLNPACLSQ